MPVLDLSTTTQKADSAFSTLHTILQQVMQAKIDGNAPDTLENTDLSLELFDAMDSIKDLHSTMNGNTRNSKQTTTEAKNDMDEKYVGLQNTMYEKRHILEEILKCQQLRSVYQHVELLPLESFEASAPDRYRQGNDNPHTLMIHRLLFEKDERTSLQEQEERLALVRQELIKENRKGQDKLDRYDKLLDDFVLATAPLEDALKDDQTKPEMETDDPAAQPDAVMMDVDTEEA